MKQTKSEHEDALAFAIQKATRERDTYYNTLITKTNQQTLELAATTTATMKQLFVTHAEKIASLTKTLESQRVSEINVNLNIFLVCDYCLGFDCCA